MAVEWTVESEVVQAAELLDQWRRRSPIEVSDGLKLLSKNVAYQTGLVSLTLFFFFKWIDQNLFTNGCNFAL